MTSTFPSGPGYVARCYHYAAKWQIDSFRQGCGCDEAADVPGSDFGFDFSLNMCWKRGVVEGNPTTHRLDDGVLPAKPGGEKLSNPSGGFKHFKAVCKSASETLRFAPRRSYY